MHVHQRHLHAHKGTTIQNRTSTIFAKVVLPLKYDILLRRVFMSKDDSHPS